MRWIFVQSELNYLGCLSSRLWKAQTLCSMMPPSGFLFIATHGAGWGGAEWFQFSRPGHGKSFCFIIIDWVVQNPFFQSLSIPSTILMSIWTSLLSLPPPWGIPDCPLGELYFPQIINHAVITVSTFFQLLFFLWAWHVWHQNFLKFYYS